MGVRRGEHRGGVGEARGGGARAPPSAASASSNRAICREVTAPVGFIRAREVAHGVERLRHPGVGRERAPHFREIRRGESESMHPRIDLDPEPHRRPRGSGADDRDLRRGVHHRVDPLAREPVERLGVPKPSKNENGAFDARPPQGQGLLHSGHRKAVRLRQRPRGPYRSVAVGVRLDHGQHPARARQSADRREVAGECAQVDAGGRPGPSFGGRPLADATIGASPTRRVVLELRDRARKVKVTVSVGPLRCLPMMISALPLSALSSL